MYCIFIWFKIAGVTLMALGAMAKYEGLDVKIVPCGKTYWQDIHTCIYIYFTIGLIQSLKA